MPRLHIQLRHPDNEVHRKYMMEFPSQIGSPTFPKEIYDAITALKEDSGFKEAFEPNINNEYQLDGLTPPQ